jgi:hypothetical protein
MSSRSQERTSLGDPRDLSFELSSATEDDS